MKLCILVNNFRPPWAEGGKNNMREILARWRGEHEILCLGLGEEDSIDRSEGYLAYTIRSPFYWTRFARLFYLWGYLRLALVARPILRREKPDLILCYFETASTAFFGYLVKLLAGTEAPLVHTVYSDWYDPSRAPWRAWLTEHLPHLVLNSRLASWFALRFVDRVTASSRYLVERVRSLGCREVAFTPTGVNVRRFRPDPRPRQRFREKLVLGYLGHLSHAKGVPLLLEAVLPVLETLDARLLIAATDGGDEAAALEGFDHPRVTLSQLVDPAEFLNACDLFVLPRRRSSGAVSYPNVLLEAMACGVPALTSDLPAVREIITDGENGFLFEPNNAEHLRNRILELAGKPDLLVEAGRNARQFVEDNLDWDDLALKTAEAIGLELGDASHGAAPCRRRATPVSEVLTPT